MDNDYVLNLDEILRTVQTADVITVRFLLLERRLLIDFRCSDIDGPMVKLVPRVNNSEERFRSLRKLRPRFALPDKLTAIQWLKYVRTMDTTGVWEAVMKRMAESGFASAVRDCEQVFRELQALERLEVYNAVTGKDFQTVWQRAH